MFIIRNNLSESTAFELGYIYSKYPHLPYAQRYYDHYTCDIAIAKLEKYGIKPPEEDMEPDEYKLSFISKLVKAYPYTVSSIPYSAGPAQLVKVTVGFYYEYSHLIT